MHQSLRIKKKIITYSYLCKVLGIISEKEYEIITGKSSSKIRKR